MKDSYLHSKRWVSPVVDEREDQNKNRAPCADPQNFPSFAGVGAATRHVHGVLQLAADGQSSAATARLKHRNSSHGAHVPLAACQASAALPERAVREFLQRLGARVLPHDMGGCSPRNVGETRFDGWLLLLAGRVAAPAVRVFSLPRPENTTAARYFCPGHARHLCGGVGRTTLCRPAGVCAGSSGGSDAAAYEHDGSKGPAAWSHGGARDRGDSARPDCRPRAEP